MKRIAIVTCALAMAAGTANAQGLTMQMSNGWNFSFSGNVNAFLVYTDPKCSDGAATCNFAGSLVPTGDEAKASRIRTGLLPAFATFEAKGKEAGVDLGVHFGFAPQINNAQGVHDNFGNGTQAGAQIDMRQVYLTAGGTWGQVLAGREIGLYQRNNILNDMTLFGVGASGGGKSVLMRTIIGLIRKRSGHIDVGGMDIDDIRDRDPRAGRPSEQERRHPRRSRPLRPPSSPDRGLQRSLSP